ncbi:hypothetical protein [Phenylobacterium sp.]|jgi:DNA-binding IclR family transcriptional regulator|uniref:hypothetical protein n=1 Tax=Phenylobacterium sp. TaxID=1871053 RepID=UPI002F93252B
MTAQAPLTSLRVLGRISVAFLLDIIRTGRMDREFLDGLITLAIVQANVTPLASDPALQRAYADYESLPPDELRRPVSVSAVAQSLKLPYETVRRRVAAMARGGGFELTPQGVYVTGEMLNNPAHKAVMIANHDLIRDFYLRLRRLGALDEVAAIAAPDGPAAQPVRAVARVSSDYVLRITDVICVQVGDLVRGLVLLDIIRANTEHLPDDERGTDLGGPASFVPDELRRPVTVAALSTRLQVPHETVRRHVARLVEDRLCQKTPDGLLVPAHVLARENFVRLMAENHMHVRRMFAALARLGVTAPWEQLAQDRRATA